MRYVARRRFSYGSRPWGVFDTEAGRFVEVERRTPGGEFRGFVAFFERKLDAVACIAAILPLKEKDTPD